MKFVRLIAAALLPISLLVSVTAFAQEFSVAGARVPVTIANGGTGGTTSTGTGAVVLAASPTVSGTLTTANIQVVGGSITFSTSNTKVSAPIYISNGTAPTPTGTCAIQTQSTGTNAGKFNANGACTGGTIIFTFGAASTTGWACQAHDLTTPADALNQTAFTTTTATFTGTLVSGDLVTWSCVGF